MSSTLTVTDQIVPMLLKLEKNGRGFALQAMNKSGAKARKELVRDTKSAGYSDITQRFNGGSRLLEIGRKKLFSRYDQDTGAKLPSLGDLSKWKLHPISGVLLVGFINTKQFKTYEYNGGVLTGTGIGSSANTKSIADKIISGRTDTATKKQRRFFGASGLHTPSQIRYKAHPDVLKFGKYTSILNRELDVAFNQAINQAKIA